MGLGGEVTGCWLRSPEWDVTWTRVDASIERTACLRFGRLVTARTVLPMHSRDLAPENWADIKASLMPYLEERRWE